MATIVTLPTPRLRSAPANEVLSPLRPLTHAELAAHAARGRQLQALAMRAAFIAAGRAVTRGARKIPQKIRRLGLHRAGLYDAGCPDRTPC